MPAVIAKIQSWTSGCVEKAKLKYRPTNAVLDEKRFQNRACFTVSPSLSNTAKSPAINVHSINTYLQQVAKAGTDNRYRQHIVSAGTENKQ